MRTPVHLQGPRTGARGDGGAEGKRDKPPKGSHFARPKTNASTGRKGQRLKSAKSTLSKPDIGSSCLKKNNDSVLTIHSSRKPSNSLSPPRHTTVTASMHKPLKKRALSLVTPKSNAGRTENQLRKSPNKKTENVNLDNLSNGRKNSVNPRSGSASPKRGQKVLVGDQTAAKSDSNYKDFLQNQKGRISKSIETIINLVKDETFNLLEYNSPIKDTRVSVKPKNSPRKKSINSSPEKLLPRKLEHVPKKRGRPFGSKNKVKSESPNKLEEKASKKSKTTPSPLLLNIKPDPDSETKPVKRIKRERSSSGLSENGMVSPAIKRTPKASPSLNNSKNILRNSKKSNSKVVSKVKGTRGPYLKPKSCKAINNSKGSVQFKRNVHSKESSSEDENDPKDHEKLKKLSHKIPKSKNKPTKCPKDLRKVNSAKKKPLINHVPKLKSTVLPPRNLKIKKEPLCHSSQSEYSTKSPKKALKEKWSRELRKSVSKSEKVDSVSSLNRGRRSHPVSYEEMDSDKESDVENDTKPKIGKFTTKKTPSTPKKRVKPKKEGNAAKSLALALVPRRTARMASLNAIAMMACMNEDSKIPLPSSSSHPGTSMALVKESTVACARSGDDSDDSESDTPMTSIPKKSTKLKKEIVSENKVKVKRKRRRGELDVFMDMKDMVVTKRMASLNASAIMAASYSTDRRVRNVVASEEVTKTNVDYKRKISYKATKNCSQKTRSVITVQETTKKVKKAQGSRETEVEERIIVKKKVKRRSEGSTDATDTDRDEGNASDASDSLHEMLPKSPTDEESRVLMDHLESTITYLTAATNTAPRTVTLSGVSKYISTANGKTTTVVQQVQRKQTTTAAADESPPVPTLPSGHIPPALTQVAAPDARFPNTSRPRGNYSPLGALEVMQPVMYHPHPPPPSHFVPYHPLSHHPIPPHQMHHPHPHQPQLHPNSPGPLQLSPYPPLAPHSPPYPPPSSSNSPSSQPPLISTQPSTAFRTPARSLQNGSSSANSSPPKVAVSGDRPQHSPIEGGERLHSAFTAPAPSANVSPHGYQPVTGPIPTSGGSPGGHYKTPKASPGPPSGPPYSSPPRMTSPPPPQPSKPHQANCDPYAPPAPLGTYQPYPYPHPHPYEKYYYPRTPTHHLYQPPPYGPHVGSQYPHAEFGYPTPIPPGAGPPTGHGSQDGYASYTLCLPAPPPQHPPPHPGAPPSQLSTPSHSQALALPPPPSSSAHPHPSSPFQPPAYHHCGGTNYQPFYGYPPPGAPQGNVCCPSSSKNESAGHYSGAQSKPPDPEHGGPKKQDSISNQQYNKGPHPNQRSFSGPQVGPHPIPTSSSTGYMDHDTKMGHGPTKDGTKLYDRESGRPNTAGPKSGISSRSGVFSSVNKMPSGALIEEIVGNLKPDSNQKSPGAASFSKTNYSTTSPVTSFASLTKTNQITSTASSASRTDAAAAVSLHSSPTPASPLSSSEGQRIENPGLLGSMPTESNLDSSESKMMVPSVSQNPKSTNSCVNGPVKVPDSQSSSESNSQGTVSWNAHQASSSPVLTNSMSNSFSNMTRAPSSNNLLGTAESLANSDLCTKTLNSERLMSSKKQSQEYITLNKSAVVHKESNSELTVNENGKSKEKSTAEAPDSRGASQRGFVRHLLCQPLPSSHNKTTSLLAKAKSSPQPLLKTVSEDGDSSKSIISSEGKVIIKMANGRSSPNESKDISRDFSNDFEGEALPRKRGRPPKYKDGSSSQMYDSPNVVNTDNKKHFCRAPGEVGISEDEKVSRKRQSPLKSSGARSASAVPTSTNTLKKAKIGSSSSPTTVLPQSNYYATVNPKIKTDIPPVDMKALNVKTEGLCSKIKSENVSPKQGCKLVKPKLLVNGGSDFPQTPIPEFKDMVGDPHLGEPLKRKLKVEMDNEASTRVEDSLPKTLQKRRSFESDKDSEGPRSSSRPAKLTSIRGRGVRGGSQSGQLRKQTSLLAYLKEKGDEIDGPGDSPEFSRDNDRADLKQNDSEAANPSPSPFPLHHTLQSIRGRRTSGAGKGSKCPRKPKHCHGWSWEGAPNEGKVWLRNDEELLIRKCYKGIKHKQGDTIRVRDCVLLRSGPKKTDLPFVAKVAALWEDSETADMMMSILWYYRPEHTDSGRRDEDLADEIFASKHRDHLSVACIEDRCYVLTFNEYCRYRRVLRLFQEKVHPSNSPVPETDHEYLRRERQPPGCVVQDLLLFCRKVYDYRQKRILKNPC